MKNFKFKWAALLLALTATFACISLTACGDDKDEDELGTAYSIVGTWSCGNHYYGGTDYYTFNSNGTYSWSCPGTWFNSQSGNYSYTNGLLLLVNNEGTTWTFVISFSNKNTFTLIDEDGDRYTYVRE